jgi:hypothetical protein
MNILVNHQISDLDAYWGALGANPAIPEGFKLVTFMAGADPSASACLWSAPDVASLELLVDKTLGNSSSNSYMIINDSKSFGL